MALKIACPNSECRAVYTVPENRVGTIAQCKQCGQSFTLRISKDDTSKVWHPPPPKSPSSPLHGELPKPKRRSES